MKSVVRAVMIVWLLVMIPVITARVFAPALSSTGTLSYVENDKIYLLDVDRNLIAWLMTAPDRIFSPSWTGDGREIFYLTGGGKFYRYSLATRESTYITSHFTGYGNGLSVAPDASQFAYESDKFRSVPSIFLMNPDTLEEVMIAGRDYPVESPAWSPDGSQLAYIEAPWGERHIALYDITTRTAKRITTAPLENTAHLTWSSDGKMIAFTEYRPVDAAGDAIMMLDVETGEVTDVARSHPAVSYSTPTWEPNRKWLIFRHWDNRTVDLYRANIATKQVQRLTWSPRVDERDIRWVPW